MAPSTESPRALGVTRSAARPGRGWPAPPPGPGVGGGLEHVTSEPGNHEIPAPPHALKFSLLPALKSLFSKEKENAKLHPLCKGMEPP